MFRMESSWSASSSRALAAIVAADESAGRGGTRGALKSLHFDQPRVSRDAAGWGQTKG